MAKIFEGESKGKEPLSPEKGVEKALFRDRALFFNRELSWLAFNSRVLDEALREETPLLERVKFLSIFFANLDEFFMIRVSGLHRQVEMGALVLPPDGMTPVRQLALLRQRLVPLLDRAYGCWREVLLPGLAGRKVRLLEYADVDEGARRLLEGYFRREIFPILTPQAVDPGRPFPLISNLSVNLLVVLDDSAVGKRYVRLKIPRVISRLLPIPFGRGEASPALAERGRARGDFVWLEDIVAANLQSLFPGHRIEGAYPFRVTRNADMELQEDEGSDLLTAVQVGLEQRRFGPSVRLEVTPAMPEAELQFLLSRLELTPFQIYRAPDHLDLASLSRLARLERPDLKDEPFLPLPARSLCGDDPFGAVAEGDILLYHPYDSFVPVVDLIRRAAKDPDVLAIKMTLYRVGPGSPLVEALMEARTMGKQVTALVELKARFDEEHNISWARALEQAGVHVVYGLVGLKTHAKMCLIIRREEEGLRSYVHLGTGNYNHVTTTLYSDFALLSVREELAADVADLFNALTGYSRKKEYRRLLVAPGNMREALVSRIAREAEQHRLQGGGRIVMKMNQLVDRACIEALYEASRAGVPIDLQVRGICCLRPGLAGVSETIRVTSLVGRFLEHSRLYYFRNGGDEELFMGSADLMPRNLDRRVEILFPVESPSVRKAIMETVMAAHLDDTKGLSRLLPDGSYERILPSPGEAPFDSHSWMIAHRGAWRQNEGGER
ncbi:polyphosphate kinase 1 [Aminirod propionatiphilus]|uniref:Polyphosphate kinase 1 n=1 Tax=Aminirod propionatiphilus TaxID=3415223 RepID=A0ACD1DXN3_9BACT|nr:polyphosphate kinase 1 [Synergistota bacterium]